MSLDWQELKKMTGDEPIRVERVSVVSKNISIEGSFELPPLAKLSDEDQVFVAAFVRSHGSIKEMERVFGVSYPTVKGKLTRISQSLGFLDPEPVSDKRDILDRLEKGEISAAEAAELLKEAR
jgi:hypothetical protein